MHYTLGQASKVTGVSKPSIFKALTKGRLTGSKGEDGNWQIEASELNRVFPITGTLETPAPREGNEKKPVDNGVLLAQIKALEELKTTLLAEKQADRAFLQAQIEAKDEQLKEALTTSRALLAAPTAEREKAQAVITKQRDEIERLRLELQRVTLETSRANRGIFGWLKARTA